MARILIVDDDNAVQATIRLLLEEAGHEVVAANDGHFGLDLAETDAFDLIFLDIFMPGMDGFETMRRLRQQQQPIPIIAISGRPIPADGADGPDFLAMATRLGAVRSLHKPFRATVLLETAAACLESANRPSSSARNAASGADASRRN